MDQSNNQQTPLKKIKKKKKKKKIERKDLYLLKLAPDTETWKKKFSGASLFTVTVKIEKLTRYGSRNHHETESPVQVWMFLQFWL